ncbi:MAG TPA: HD domain-containing protein [Myxococcota bacterium]|nr:HD domain-containing protein [Myxococcota bacterium]HQE73860.1 HD domain-containing protein [Myxococcota bacterium]HRR74232.1 HD domain-containing protein [Myxococcota bacterium]
MDRNNREQYKPFEIWHARPEPVTLEELLTGIEDPTDIGLITGVYQLAQELYSRMKRRKNGQQAFVHPTNVARFLKLAGCKPYVIAIGLLHDVPEERTDHFFNEYQELHPDASDPIRMHFSQEISDLCYEVDVRPAEARLIVGATDALTRKRSDNYYESINDVFNNADRQVAYIAAMVKMADRMHNILTIDNYEATDKIYQCYKNLSILNSAKVMVTGMTWDARAREAADSIVTLFKKCGKATYRELLRLAHSVNIKDHVFPMVTYLSLAFQKYLYEMDRLVTVTDSQLGPGSPIYELFDGIIFKYDCKLKKATVSLDEVEARELEFCKATFAKLGLTDKELKSAMYYKDATALAGVIGLLLYKQRFVVGGFGISVGVRR